MNIIALIQARLGSSRFQNKTLADLAGRPMIAHVIERVSAIRGLSGVVLAVPSQDAKAFAEVVDGPVIYCDPMVAEHDVLGRFAAAALAYPADAYLRVTGDCPLLAPDVAERVMAQYQHERADFAHNDTTISGYPDGTDVEVFSAVLLLAAHLGAMAPVDREHVTPWMRRAVGVRQTMLRCERRYTSLKWSVDSPADAERVRAILEARPKDFSFAATVQAAKA